MGYNASIILCILAIIICTIALVMNVIVGSWVWALVMVLCIALNLISLLRLYNIGRYL